MGWVEGEVKKLMARTGATYEEAERILIKCGGDLDKAYYKLLQRERSVLLTVFNYFYNIFIYSLIIKRKKTILIDLPIVVIAIFAVIFMSMINNGYYSSGIVIISFLAIVFSGCDLILKNPNTKEFSFKKREVYEIVEPKKSYNIVEEEPEDSKVEEDQDGYNKISIE